MCNGVCNEQREDINGKLWELLTPTDGILDSNKIISESLKIIKDNPELRTVFEYRYNEKFHCLIRDFSRKIFSRGLYASIDDSDKKTLTSTEDNVYIGSLWMCGRCMITISSGDAGDTDYKQITFMLEAEDPTTLTINSYYGKFEDLQMLIDIASKRFIDLKMAITFMQPGTVNFGGVTIGK
jgi:hypothetical protein